MVEVRACVYFSVIFLCFNIVSAKPIFINLACNLLCEDDGGTSTTTTTSSDYDMWDDWCNFCDSTRLTAATVTPPPAVTNPMPAPWSVIIPASPNAINLTMWNNPATSGSWFMNMMPWGGMQAPAMPTPAAQVATTPAPAATTVAAATTAAAGAATTAAPAATTVAAAA